MTAKALKIGAEKKTVEEAFVHNHAVSVCLLINRRQKTMRVIDFRAGPSTAKRNFVLSLAKREGIEKVYTLVERDEVSTWSRMGFHKEGNLPGFYKRSDAFMLGCSVKGAELSQKPIVSETRIVAAKSREPDPYYVPPSLVAAPEEEAAEPETNPAYDFAEKTLVQAKKRAKEMAGKPLPLTKISLLTEMDVRKPVATALRGGKAMTAFEPFGRDVQRRYFSIGAKGFSLIVSTEQQSCFGNAFLELLTAPNTDNDALAATSALRALCNMLLAEGTVSCFSLVPSDDVKLAAAFAFNGFRRTGLLENHIVLGGKRKDVIIFSRKLANPSED